MNSIVLFSSENEWEPETWMTLMKGYISDEGQFIVETSDSWISIIRYDEVLDDYEEDEKELVRNLIRDPIPYLIEWRGDELLKQFVDKFPLNSGGVIDNDHGLICNISELKEKSVNDWLNVK